MAEVTLLRGAEQDAMEIYFDLFERNPDRAEQFSASVDEAMADLAAFPEIGRPIGDRFRRKLVPNFYDYGVFYALDHSLVMIHAILNLRQDPDQIQRRLGL